MAFKRSAVRSRLSPPKNLGNTCVSKVFSILNCSVQAFFDGFGVWMTIIFAEKVKIGAFFAPRNLNGRNWWGKLVECNLRFC